MKNISSSLELLEVRTLLAGDSEVVEEYNHYNCSLTLECIDSENCLKAIIIIENTAENENSTCWWMDLADQVFFTTQTYLDEKAVIELLGQILGTIMVSTGQALYALSQIEQTIEVLTNPFSAIDLIDRDQGDTTVHNAFVLLGHTLKRVALEHY